MRFSTVPKRLPTFTTQDHYEIVLSTNDDLIDYINQIRYYILENIGNKGDTRQIPNQDFSTRLYEIDLVFDTNTRYPTQPDPTRNIFSIPEPDPKLKNPSDPGYIPALYYQKAASVVFAFFLA